MRVITLNANGIRAAQRKGFFDWLRRQRADVVCLQEVRAQAQQIAERGFHPGSFRCHYHLSARKGYGGVAVYSRSAPDRVVEGLGWAEMDAEARWLEVHLGPVAVVSLYIPSGSSGDARQAVKYRFMDRLMSRLRKIRRESSRPGGRQYIICGDWNIAHKPIDLRNWRSNQKNSGFLPEERAWLDAVFGRTGLVDAFRVVNQSPDQYTWWSNRGRAWENNVGWRLDYQVVTPGLRDCVRRAAIYTARRFSDHAPLTMDYDLVGP